MFFFRSDSARTWNGLDPGTTSVPPMILSPSSSEGWRNFGSFLKKNNCGCISAYIKIINAFLPSHKTEGLFFFMGNYARTLRQRGMHFCSSSSIPQPLLWTEELGPSRLYRAQKNWSSSPWWNYSKLFCLIEPLRNNLLTINSRL